MDVVSTEHEIIILDNVLSKEQCDQLVECYNSAPQELVSRVIEYNAREGLCLNINSHPHTAECEKILFNTVGKLVTFLRQHYKNGNAEVKITIVGNKRLKFNSNKVETFITESYLLGEEA